MPPKNEMMSLLASMLILTLGCAGAEPRPTPTAATPSVENKIDALETLKAGCHLEVGQWLCTGEAISAAGHGLIDLEAALADALAQLDQSGAMGEIDRAELAGQLWDVTQERDKALSQRWVWGGIALGLGLVVGGGIMAWAMH